MSFTGMVATGTFALVLSDASPAWAAPKKKKKAKAAATTDDAATPAAATDSADKSTDDLMSDSAKSKSKAQIKADKDAATAAETPDKEKIDEPDAWEKPPVEDEQPKPKKIYGNGAVVEQQPPKSDGRKFDVGIVLGVGLETSKYFSVDPYGFGFGLHVNYEFDMHLFVGVGAEYFIGSSGAAANVGINTMSTSAHYLLVHAEVGYDAWLSQHVILRPSVWLGVAIGTQNPPMASGTSGVETAFLIAPGLAINYLLGDSRMWFIGADARLALTAGDGSSAFTLLATVGLRF
ncbi:MAG TPA: hypothetical protein VGI70_02080 [Polyangiales bacterium]